jgi:ubiquitin carboxyl-terminal hydrolase 7
LANRYDNRLIHIISCLLFLLIHKVAKKHCKFARFPSVLLVHLKRFEIVEQGNRYFQNKLNDKLVFSPILHLGLLIAINCFLFPILFHTNFTDDFLLEPSKDADENTFQLHGVLVHRGSINQGHYLAYLRPSNDNDWYEFDDHKVRKVCSSPSELYQIY